ncbi:MAG: hypothetical protein ACYTGH_04800 [Planctomycetota bacterium]|jgi:hypothetical protein
MKIGWVALVTVFLLGSVGLAADAPIPTYYQGFEKGRIDGPVGRAGHRFKTDGRALVDLDRGTLAFFHQSKNEPSEMEWNNIGGVHTHRQSGYWGMGALFQTRRQDFLFNLYDIGFYAPPLHLPSPFGRWKAGEWHHLCAVWDRAEGIKVYEDGKLVDSNWGEYHWQWSVLPKLLSVAAPVDEVYVYNQCLTDAQVAELAVGKAPTGPAIPISEPAKRRAKDLARYGWFGESLAALTVVTAQKAQQLTFARIKGCRDARRPVAQPIDGYLSSSWPDHKYGASIRGQRLTMTFEDGVDCDRIAIFSHRNLNGELLVPEGREERAIGKVNIPHATFFHQRLSEPLTGTELTLKRKYGQLGQIMFYRSDALTERPATGTSYSLAKLEAFPATDQGKTLQGETPHRFWNPVALSPEKSEAWSLTTTAFGGFQAMAEEPKGGEAIDGILIDLVVEGLSEPTPVHIEVKEPIHTERTWLVADLALHPKGTGKQTYTVRLKGRPVITLPPMEYEVKLKKKRTELRTMPGQGISVCVTAANSATWSMGEGGTSVRLCSVDKASILEKAADDQIEFMRDAYSYLMEGHLYREKSIQLPIRWLARFAPQRRKFQQMWERVDTVRPNFVDVNVPAIEWTAPANDTGWPEWAFWQKRAMDRLRKHLHWIIDNKQIWTGEIGGIWNDDSTHVENWMGYMLALDGSGKIKTAMDRYWDGVWRYQLTDGVGKYTQDAGHYSEEGSSNLGMRLLIEYGNPLAYARTLQATKKLSLWLIDNGKGGLKFKSFYPGPDGAWMEGAFDLSEKKVSGHAMDLLVSPGYLAWYNRHPEAGRILSGFISRAGFVRSARARYNDPAAVREDYRKALENPFDPYNKPSFHIDAINEVGLTEAQRTKLAIAYKALPKIPHYRPWQSTDTPWFYWKVSGDERFLVDTYKRVLEWFNSHDWLNSEAMPSMDRCPLPRNSVIRSRLGATVANRGSSYIMYPYHAISFTKGTDQVASLVTENLENRMAVRLYPFTAKELPVQIRTWRLNGRFTVTLADDTDNDGKADAVRWSREMDLETGSAIDLVLPAKQGAILSATLIKAKVVDYAAADPAISLDTCELVYGDHLVVKVYNNGLRPVKDLLVRVCDAKTGRVVANGEKRIAEIEAPTDLVPRWKRVEFKNINCNTWGAFSIEIDPEKKAEDRTRLNNKVLFKYRSTFDLPYGWH